MVRGTAVQVGLAALPLEWATLRARLSACSTMSRAEYGRVARPMHRQEGEDYVKRVP
ncbi:MAG: hypothetical protein R6U08_03630 [Bacillota bacterium]